MRSGDGKEEANETPSTKDKQLEAHENGNVQEINHGPSNGKLENGSHSNGSHQVPNGAEPKTEYLFEINKTQMYPTEVDKDKHVTEAQPKVEEYDLQKILDQQETHDLFCPNYKSCITRRVILKKRKRTVRPANPHAPSKRPYTEEVLVPLPSATLPGSDEQESPDVLRCLSCFSFFIPAGCSFNIFRIFGRRDLDQVDVLPPPASVDTPPRSENCTSWLLSCFQPEDCPNQPHPAGFFQTDTLEMITGEMPPSKPDGGANHHLLGHDDVHRTATTASENGFTTHSVHASGVKVNGPNVTNVARGDISTTPIPQTTDSHHVAVSVPEEVNLVAPRPQQRDDWDIPKAIVYGGLVESVTSLSVVSAAASSGAKTLDIFILGIANLIGGLPVIYHNIADLRDIRDVDDDNEQVGQYWLQLGRRSKAQLHMVLALLSYIVFGLLPPVIYGLSFRESNDRENKMMAVAGASLACIALLALGKAHVQTAPRAYFKTLMYYLTIAVSSSGLSYVAGVLITRLLEHFGTIEQGGLAAPAPPGLSFAHSEGAQTSAWASF
ncbi:hypothetical protein VPH35_120107 [Triticum aestivum]